MSTDIHIRGYQALDEIVRETCSIKGDDHLSRYSIYYVLAVKALRELSYDTMNQPKREYVKVDSKLRRAYLPKDYVNYITIGVVVNGNIYALGLNSRMATAAPDDCGNPGIVEGGGNLKGTSTNNQDSDNLLPWSTYLNRYTPQFGHGGGYNRRGYYRIDKENGWIDFNSDFGFEEIVLDYVSSGYEIGERNYVHVFAKDAIHTYIDWKEMDRKADTNPSFTGRSERKRREFIKAKMNLRQRVSGNTLYEVVAAARSSFGFAPHN